jgi:hypothetical protein
MELTASLHQAGLKAGLYELYDLSATKRSTAESGRDHHHLSHHSTVKRAAE